MRIPAVLAGDALQYARALTTSSSSARALARQAVSRKAPARRASNNSSLDTREPRPDHAPSSNKSNAHHDLASFQAYAERTNLSQTSTVYVGTLYEYQCLAALTQLGFRLTRSGGRADAGVDLYGTWRIPSHPQPLRCIVQCKAQAAKAGPNLVRELEGAFTRAPPGWRGDQVLGILCSSREASKGVREAVRWSSRGLGWIMIDPRPEPGPRIAQIVWNQRVAELGAMGLAVGMVYDGAADVGASAAASDSAAAHGVVGSKPLGHARLMWKGKIWNPGPDADEDMC